MNKKTVKKLKKLEEESIIIFNKLKLDCDYYLLSRYEEIQSEILSLHIEITHKNTHK